MTNLIQPGQLTLGELIAKLKRHPVGNQLQLDFCHLLPGPCMSYRGFYDHLAITYYDIYDKPDRDSPEVGTYLSYLENVALNKTFTGYKGGNYVMHADVPVWVANYGRTSETFVVGVEDNEPYGTTVIRTGWHPL